jgi:DNA-binding FadR family transcriptional regulator
MRKNDSELLNYLIEHGNHLPDNKLPSLEELSVKLDLSTGKLREQLEAARTMGFVEVRPKTGIRPLAYSFTPAVRFSLFYALSRDHTRFEQFSELRNHVEFAFFHEAVSKLTEADCDHLKDLVKRAWDKLEGQPTRIPHPEHRDLHLTIFKQLDNPFVLGILESYWDAYEAEGMNVFNEYEYLHEVWKYHEGIVDAIIEGDNDEAYRLLVQHTKLIQKNPRAKTAKSRNGKK